MRAPALRSAVALAAAAGALAVAPGAGAADTRAARITFSEVTPGWYAVSAVPAAPVKVTLRYGIDCSWISAQCAQWRLVGTKVLPRGATGEAARISWLRAGFWGVKGAEADQLPEGFYRMALVVPGQPASRVDSQWRLASGD